MATAYVRAVGRAAGAPSDFRGPMAKQQRMFCVTLLAVWCGLGPTGWSEWSGIGLPALVLAAIAALSVLTALRRLRHTARALRTMMEP